MSERSDSQDRPPILGTWKKLYLFVFGQLVVLIMLFYLFTKYYS